MNESEWREKFLEAVAACSAEGKEAVDYIRARGTHIGFKRARKNVGAFWWLLNRSVYLNTAHYSREAALASPGAWGLLIHEVRHLQQGPWVALSIYGELDAWQVQMRLMKQITGGELHPALEEIIALPLNLERENLRRARRLMTAFAGVLYGAYLYPLYPIHKEIQYWVCKVLRCRATTLTI